MIWVTSPQATEMPLAMAVALSTTTTKKNPNFVEIGKEMLVLHKVHQQINSNGLVCISGNHSS